MIKFFRKIRQRLLTESKFTKYLLYAIGEIILVVIGILIALQINNNNEANKEEIKVRTILTQIQDELAINIIKADEILRYYCNKDSLIYLVMNNQLTKTDYKITSDNNHQDVFELGYLIYNYGDFIIIDNGYKILMQNIGILPKKFQNLIEPLNNLYENDKADVYKCNVLIAEEVSKNSDFLNLNKKWASSLTFQNKIDDEVIEYFLLDPFYKNQVSSYSTIALNHLRMITKFRTDAKLTFNRITDVLGYKEINYSFIINPYDYKKWLGKYTGPFNENDFETEIVFKENTLFQIHSDTINDEIIPLSDNLYISTKFNLFNRIISNDEGETVKIITHWKNLKVESKKIN